MTCTECGAVLLAERVELGFDYCTRPECQKRRHRGLRVTTVGVPKSADTLLVAGDGEIERRGESGEFAGRDGGIGLDYRTASPASRPRGAARRATTPPARAGTRRWSRLQEDVVRLYHDMGLSTDQIVERARRNNPRLAITRPLVIAVLATPATRRR